MKKIVIVMSLFVVQNIISSECCSSNSRNVNNSSVEVTRSSTGETAKKAHRPKQKPKAESYAQPYTEGYNPFYRSNVIQR